MVAVSLLTKVAVAANAVVDSGPARIPQEIAISEASATFLIQADPDERAINCNTWGNPSTGPTIVIKY
jgi:hypothetical protein